MPLDFSILLLPRKPQEARCDAREYPPLPQGYKVSNSGKASNLIKHIFCTSFDHLLPFRPRLLLRAVSPTLQLGSEDDVRLDGFHASILFGTLVSQTADYAQALPLNLTRLIA